ncbi:MAG: hypothetical protein ACP6IU_12340 [Candidatus Asgardarchaeia archaeon]
MSDKSDSFIEFTEQKTDEVAQLIAALSARWIGENGKIRYGVPEKKLLSIFKNNKKRLNALLSELERNIEPLGLMLVKYYMGNEKWYCLRTVYGVPTELTNDEYAVLGVIISIMERKKNKTAFRKKELYLKLVTGGYMSQYQLDTILKRLELLGYINIEKGNISYGPRLQIEFDDERRKKIAEKASELIF